MEDKLDDMKQYTIAIFTQELCKPCIDLHEHIRQLPTPQQDVISFYNMKTLRGVQTAWCEELGVELTPTMVVVHNDRDDTPIEKVVGAKAIIASLPSTISDYTYIETNIDNIHPDQSNDKEERNRS